VPLGQAGDAEGLLAAVGPAQLNAIADSQLAMRLAALTVDLDLPALAGALRFRSCLVETGDIQPDIQPNGSGVQTREA
jgi:hypothetical protein